MRSYLYSLEEKTKVVLNRDDDAFTELKETVNNYVTYGFDEESDYMIKGLTISKKGLVFTLVHEEKEYIPLEEGVTDKEAFDSFNFLEYTGTEIVDAIKKLDEKYRYPIFLKYVYGYRISEIASILGLSDNLVLQRLYRGRNKVVSFLTGGETDYE